MKSALREVVCEEGPMDGAVIDVPADTNLPDTLEIPCAVLVRRDIYRLVGESAERARYRFVRTEVRG